MTAFKYTLDDFRHRKEKPFILKTAQAKFLIRFGTIDHFIVDEVWSRNVYLTTDYEIKPHDTVVEIGGQVGTFSVKAAKLANRGRVLTYEPFKPNYDLLKKNLGLNKITNADPFNIGVADRVGKKKLYISEANSGGHSVIYRSEKAVTMRTTTLEQIMKQNRLDRINFLKIDAEGAEYEILSNVSPDVFARIDKIVLEHHPGIDMRNLPWLADLLQKNGFRVETKLPIFFQRFLPVGILRARRVDPKEPREV